MAWLTSDHGLDGVRVDWPENVAASPVRVWVRDGKLDVVRAALKRTMHNLPTYEHNPLCWRWLPSSQPHRPFQRRGRRDPCPRKPYWSSDWMNSDLTKIIKLSKRNRLISVYPSLAWCSRSSSGLPTAGRPPGCRSWWCPSRLWSTAGSLGEPWN